MCPSFSSKEPSLLKLYMVWLEMVTWHKICHLGGPVMQETTFLPYASFKLVSAFGANNP